MPSVSHVKCGASVRLIRSREMIISRTRRVNGSVNGPNTEIFFSHTSSDVRASQAPNAARDKSEGNGANGRT